MRSKINSEFRRLYKNLPPDVRKRARRAYSIWRENPRHPSLHFKRVSDTNPVYSVRIDANFRALGVIRKDAIILVLDRHTCRIRTLMETGLTCLD